MKSTRLPSPRVCRVLNKMSVPTRRDMLFSVLFVGDESLLRHLVWASAQRLGADWAWEGGVQVRRAECLLPFLLGSV